MYGAAAAGSQPLRVKIQFSKLREMHRRSINVDRSPLRRHEGDVEFSQRVVVFVAQTLSMRAW